MPVNILDNGAFHEGLDDWTGTGSVIWSDGYPRSGCAQLDNGEYIEQSESVSQDALYTLHYFYKLSSGATLTVRYGDSISQTHTGAPLSVWREGVLPFAVTESANDTVRLEASGATVYVDTIALIAGGLPTSRAEVATRVATELGDFATEQSYSTTASANGPEGDYSIAIDAALRALGAVTIYGDPDVVLVGAAGVNSIIEETTDAMLQRLRRAYALETDVQLGPRRESRSQIVGAIGQQLDKGPGAVAVRRLRHRADDYKL